MIILKSEHTIGPAFNVLDGTIEGLIEYSIEWADKVYKEVCKSKESAIAYIKLEDGELTQELKVMSKNNSRAIVYIEKIFNDVDLDQIIFNEQKQYEDLENKGYIIVKKY